MSPPKRAFLPRMKIDHCYTNDERQLFILVYLSVRHTPIMLTNLPVITAIMTTICLLFCTGCGISKDNAGTTLKSKQMLAADPLKSFDDPVITSTNSATSPSTTTDSQVLSGMKAYRDPNTGQYISKPLTNDESTEPISTKTTARNTSQPTLFEERPSDVEGGGMVIDLKGQFRETLKRTRAASDTTE